MARIGIVYYGDPEARRTARLAESRFGGIAAALEQAGAEATPAIYSDDFAEDFAKSSSELDGLLVWVNPIMPDNHDRTKFDSVLRDLSKRGVMVSTHPDMIMKMGTKQVLFDTKDTSFGSDVLVYRTYAELRRELPRSLERGKSRVLKQYRGHSGGGIYKVQLFDSTPQWTAETLVRIRHAERGNYEQTATLEDVFELFEQYFEGDGRMIDQAYQDRLVDGMTRCYMVVDKVEGFGHQEINALYPPSPGANPEDAPQPGPRLYHAADTPRFEALKRQMEDVFLPELLSTLNIARDELPLLWDADFLLGPRDEQYNDTYVLCEINVSSVSPFPPSAEEPLAKATVQRVAGKQN